MYIITSNLKNHPTSWTLLRSSESCPKHSNYACKTCLIYTLYSLKTFSLTFRIYKLFCWICQTKPLLTHLKGILEENQLEKAFRDSQGSIAHFFSPIFKNKLHLVQNDYNSLQKIRLIKIWPNIYFWIKLCDLGQIIEMEEYDRLKSMYLKVLLRSSHENKRKFLSAWAVNSSHEQR